MCAACMNAADCGLARFSVAASIAQQPLCSIERWGAILEECGGSRKYHVLFKYARLLKMEIPESFFCRRHLTNKPATSATRCHWLVLDLFSLLAVAVLSSVNLTSSNCAKHSERLIFPDQLC